MSSVQWVVVLPADMASMYPIEELRSGFFAMSVFSVSAKVLVA